MEFNSLDALLEDQLKDLYSAENMLLKALPRLAQRSSSDTLREAFETHTEETRAQVDRLRQIGQQLGITLGGKKCHAMQGLLEEGNEVLEADGDDTIIDAALIAAAQRVEHYEISAYGTARTLAHQLGHDDIADLLQQTLEEESDTDEKLTHISENELLPMAGRGVDEEEDMNEKQTTRRAAGRSKGRAAASGNTSRGKQSSRQAASRSASRGSAGKSTRSTGGQRTGGSKSAGASQRGRR